MLHGAVDYMRKLVEMETNCGNRFISVNRKFKEKKSRTEHSFIRLKELTSVQRLFSKVLKAKLEFRWKAK